MNDVIWNTTSIDDIDSVLCEKFLNITGYHDNRISLKGYWTLINVNNKDGGADTIQYQYGER